MAEIEETTPTENVAEIQVQGEETENAKEEELREGENHNVMGSKQENLLTRVVSLDRKSYFLDVRENQRGRYLKLTESSPKYRNTILLSGNAITILQSVLNDAIKENYTSEVDIESLDTNWVTLFSRNTSIGQKKIYFDLMQNRRGRSINVAEVHPSRPKSAVLLSDNAWFQFRRALGDVMSAMNIEGIEQDEDEEDGYYTIVDNTHNFNSSGEAKAGASKLLASKKMQLPMKRFFFDYRENEQGRYCKITQSHRTNRESIYIPMLTIPIFISLLQVFIAEEYNAEVEGCEDGEIPENDTENHVTLSRRVINLEDDRKYIIDLRENQYGQFLRICEEKQGRGNYIFIPAECFDGFRDILDEFLSIP